MKERCDGKTPSGGDYSEVIYLNDSNEEADKDTATKAVIRECNSDGTLLNETFMLIKNS